MNIGKKGGIENSEAKEQGNKFGEKGRGVGRRVEELLDKQREELEGRVRNELIEALDREREANEEALTKQREVLKAEARNELKEALDRQQEANKEALRKQREDLEAEARKAVMVRNRGILAAKKR